MYEKEELLGNLSIGDFVHFGPAMGKNRKEPISKKVVQASHFSTDLVQT